MPRKINDSEIEKILTNFVDSDISDDETEESDIINNLFDAFESNQSFMLEELSRQGPYEINIQDIDLDNDNNHPTIYKDIADQGCSTGIVENNLSTSKSFEPKKVDQFRWKKTTWDCPENIFSETEK
ncbi:hypothetical protein FF38_10750 [Lucilia cuprina]|uniref:Uncharacterized protein n=1 Tax=Lucilia cuprina TaxID=7375 RepID=A0A0L0CKH9_LUCCU|nr:hypothetical protein FF38_10750 [Lucilia cuprina]